ncbi:hypothetical protein HYQ46_008278 [Verticillium longisporum]|nr:hypothetical protein HYQ46_008278 [Verticillium longisporum]
MPSTASQDLPEPFLATTRDESGDVRCEACTGKSPYNVTYMLHKYHLGPPWPHTPLSWRALAQQDDIALRGMSSAILAEGAMLRPPFSFCL